MRDADAIQQLMQLWCQQTFDQIADSPEERNKKYRELVTEVLPAFIVLYVKMMKTQETLDVVSTCKTVLLTVGDSASDMYALVVLLMAKSRYAITMAISLVIANVVQALGAYFAQREGPVVAGAALLGLKPLVDGYKIIFGIDGGESQFDPQFNFAF